MIIPIYKAEKFDNKEEVIGFLIPPNPDMEDGIVTFEKTDMCPDTGSIDVYTKTHQIKYHTLKISFDGGDNWNPILEVKGIVGFNNATK